MPRCPNGHESTTFDYCDTCGTPIGRIATVTPLHPGVKLVKACPICSTDTRADALFCEECGYDFTTGAKPGDSPIPLTDVLAPPKLTPVQLPPAQVPDRVPPTTASPAVTSLPTEASDSAPSPATPPADALNPEWGRWIVEQWIDPEWYATQDTDEPIPSPGPPIVTEILTKTTLIGRPSQQKGLFPRIDCDPDTGVSRRQAEIATDGHRWWIRDLDSANGTFLGRVDAPLPAMPIKGRVELSPDDRIYLGAWTRLVVRPAIPGELR